MDDRVRQVLEQVASGHVVFHTGAWGGPAGYRWRGVGGGVPSTWESVLARLEANCLIAVEQRLGPLERTVVITSDGLAALTSAG
jgi:hypothetical protein